MQEMVYWQSIYNIYKENSITITDIETNNKNEIMIIVTSDVSSCSNNPMITITITITLKP